ncbi:hypothetical protein QZH41_000400 [Actinostola sp. cb2023]|nr:hypothetical protein QZH41_000400 [Actinostola sp. cb2023]
MESWPREEVNWSEKAREYKIRRSSDQATPPYAGQILKEYLKSQEIDTSQFEKQKGPGVWWDWTQDDGVEFYDSPTQPNSRPDGPMLHHFRSSSTRKELSFLQECWDGCCTEGTELPLYKRYDSSGKIAFVKPVNEESQGDHDEIIDDEEGQHDHDERIDDEERQDDCEERIDDEERQDDCEERIEDEERQDDCEERIDDEERQDDYEERIEDEERQDDCEERIDDEERQDDCEERIDDEERQNDCEERSGGRGKNMLDKVEEQTSKRKRKHDEEPSEGSTSKKQCTDTFLKTKTGKAIEIVVGKLPEVEYFDSMKYGLTRNPQSRYYIDHYQTSLAKVQVLVLKALTAVNKDIAEWDRNFFEQNNSLPTDIDYHSDNTIIILLKRRKVASQLLGSWNMTIQLS